MKITSITFNPAELHALALSVENQIQRELAAIRDETTFGRAVDLKTLKDLHNKITNRGGN
ncbi:hypothetical protein AQUSIP_13130 [Aquicella siphonis]|uniref:Uncharacterized protein n=1 Tax=Aquicella siphonis TaxID=254247 RepID=A0A5E4PHY0_9COXI|nr:hypothetical protein [Aquicella siphonis]VVC76012.1 hypothetical protein AQUSIP_13130 [Aquicella siphonis]